MMSESASFTVIDCNVDPTPHLELLKAAGVTGIFQYLNPLGVNAKACTPERARAIAASGLRLGLVSEGWGDFAHGGISAAAGERDGEHALAQAPLLGAPDGAAVYFAVDCDASARETSKLVLPYFAAIKKVLAGKFRVGVYGSGLVCSTVLDARLADLAWLSASRGWQGSREFLASGKWALAQQLPKRIATFEFDPDDARGDCGDFVPFAAVEAASAPSAPVSPLELLAAEIGDALAREVGKLERTL